MSTENESGATESPFKSTFDAGSHSEGATGPGQRPEIRIGKSRVPADADGRPVEVEIFTMALGEEAIYLVPLKTWSQLDVHKWRVQGKLPGTPAGLEIAIDHVKMAGETVFTNDPEGCAKLEKAFNEWLALEWDALAKPKVQAQGEPESVVAPQEEPLRFEVELDKAGQAHIRCIEGKDVVAEVACTVPGITSLVNEGLIRKPGSWKVGALRDWLELDGQLFRFKEGHNGIAELQRALNERYHPAEEGGQEIRIFENPASESGFDIQFPAHDTGVTEIRRRHLDLEAMQILSDPQKCRVLRKGVVVKFTPPTFHFKLKTADGGERDLDKSPEHMVLVESKDGLQKWIDLSQPVSHLGLGAAELTAIFNHPSINRRVKRSDKAHAGDEPSLKAA